MQDLNVSESLPQLDIRYILHVLWTGKWVILACMLVALALAAVNNNFQKVIYRAQARTQFTARPSFLSPGANFNAQSSNSWNTIRNSKPKNQKLPRVACTFFSPGGSSSRIRVFRTSPAT